MAKKKSTQKDNSTDQQLNNLQPQQENPKMDPENQQQQPPVADPLEKLSSLKSLNALLLKETVEKRQEVSALLESKRSLESELTRSVSELEALKAELGRMEGVDESELDVLRRENEGLRKERDGFEKRVEEVEREMCEVVNERDEMEKAKIECDLEIGSLKKLEMELRNEVKKERECVRQVGVENDLLRKDLELKFEEGCRMKERIKELESKEKSLIEDVNELDLKFKAVVNELNESKNRVDGMKIELGSLERDCDGFKREVEGLKGEKELILRGKEGLEKEKSEQGVKMGELEKEVNGLNAIVLSLREDEQKWRKKFFELEKVNEEMGVKVGDLERELNVVSEEKKDNEKEIESLKGEKLSLKESISELGKALEYMKQEKDEIFEESNRLEQVKSRQEIEIVDLQKQVKKLEKEILKVEGLCNDYVDNNNRLLSEIDGRKLAMERVVAERDDARKLLEEEKSNGAKLQARVSEISKRMEETAKVIEELKAASDTLVTEKKELENKHNEVVKEKGLTEKKYADALMKITDLESIMRSKTNVFESAFKMLKETSGQVLKRAKGEDEGISLKDDEEMKLLNGEMDPILAELERIRRAFESREVMVGEMQQQMESLQWSVKDARKKSFWTIVSSATTLIAAFAASFAYATKVR